MYDFVPHGFISYMICIFGFVFITVYEQIANPLWVVFWILLTGGMGFILAEKDDMNPKTRLKLKHVLVAAALFVYLCTWLMQPDSTLDIRLGLPLIAMTILYGAWPFCKERVHIKPKKNTTLTIEQFKRYSNEIYKRH